MMARQLSLKGLKAWKKYGLSLLVLLAAVALWQGCSDDPVTPRKSVIGNWELITFKMDGEVVDYEYDAIMVFDADSTGYTQVYLEGDLIDEEEFESWEVNGDSLSLNNGIETVSAWYSCTDDRLTIREYDDMMEITLEWIYARMEDL